MPGGATARHGWRRSCGRLPCVPELSIEVPTSRGRLSEVRPDLERELTELLPPGLLESRWEGETLHLSGPGASGTVTLEAGRLVGRARLRPPASLMSSVIEEKITALLRAVAGPGSGDRRG